MGTIVGGYISSTDGQEHGFSYRADGTFRTLNDPVLANTTLVGIHNLGQIVGTVGLATSTSPNQLPGFLYSGGAFVQLAYGEPTGINNSGAIAINARAYGGGVLYPNGTLAIVDSYNPDFEDYAVGPYVSAINDQGTIIFPSAGPLIANPHAPEPATAGLLILGDSKLCNNGLFGRHRKQSR